MIAELPRYTQNSLARFSSNFPPPSFPTGVKALDTADCETPAAFATSCEVTFLGGGRDIVVTLHFLVKAGALDE